MTDIETITDDQIRALRDEAFEADDMMQTALCDLALEGSVRVLPFLSDAQCEELQDTSQDEARAQCAAVILAAQMERAADEQGHPKVFEDCEH